MKRKFQIGDKVRVLVGQYTGHVGKILNVATNSSRAYYYVECEKTKPYSLRCVSYELEKVEEKPIREPESKFKVGDQVIIKYPIREYYNSHAIISRIMNERYVEVRFLHKKVYGSNFGYVTVEYLEPVNNQQTQQKDMNKPENRTIEIDLETAKEWYKKGGDLRQVALQAYSESELVWRPKSWKEYVTKIKLDNLKDDLSESEIALLKLLHLRKVWTDNWTPDWTDTSTNKYIICVCKNNIVINDVRYIAYSLSFPTQEMAEEFLNCFKDLLETAKGLY